MPRLAKSPAMTMVIPTTPAVDAAYADRAFESSERRSVNDDPALTTLIWLVLDHLGRR